MLAGFVASAAHADAGRSHDAEVGHDFVTIKAGPLTVVVYKTQVWYQKMPGEAVVRP